MNVELRFLPYLWKWCWEIREGPRGELIEGSWSDAWSAYPTPEAAEAAGRARMAELETVPVPQGSCSARAA